MNYCEYVCELHPFTREQICYARKSNGEYECVGVVPIDSLCSFLVTNCYNNGTKKIHLVGPASYLKKYVEDIKYEENCHYGVCNIEVEIN